MTHHRPTICPSCGRSNPLVDDAKSDAWPNEGDWSICWKCGEVAIFDHTHHGGLRRPNIAEAAEIAADQNLQEALFARNFVLKVMP
jgi:hypothetical protein